MKRLDGSMLEGGGQILRNAAALSAVTRTPIEVTSIRAGRQNPGLSPQHLTGLELVAAMSNGRLEGGVPRSTQIQLEPQQLTCGTYTADTKTAGSCTLMMQQALPCLLFAHPPPACQGPQQQPDVSVCHLRGGTDAAMAPPISYLTDVLGPLLRQLYNLDIQLRLIRRGFYPKGGGIVEAAVRCLGSNQALPPFDMTDGGQVTSIHVKAYAAGRAAPQGAAELMMSTMTEALHRSLGGAARDLVKQEVVHETRESAFGDGGGCIAIARTSTGCILGAARPTDKGTPPEAVAQLVAEEITDAIQSGACVDHHMQDQVIVFMALAQGTSKFISNDLTLHTRTAIEVAKQLTGCHFKVTRLDEQKDLWAVECSGVGFARAL